MKHWRLGILAIACSLVLTTGVASAQTYTATVGGLGGVWYTMFAGIAELVKEKEPAVVIRVVPGGGLIAVQKVGEGASEFGFGFPWTVADGRAGRDPFKTALPDVRGVMSGFGSSYLQFVIDKKFGANSLDEIFQKKMPLKIAVDRVGTTDELALRRVMGFYKMTYDDLAKAGGKVFHAGYNDQASLFKDRQVDALFQNIAIPSSAVLEAKVGRDIQLLGFSPALMDHMYKEYAFVRGKIPAGSYGIVEQALDSPESPTMMTANVKVSADVVYRVVKVVGDNPDRVRTIHDSLKAFDPTGGWKDLGAPIHPGAERYFKEKGWMK
ncbi:MAG: TAXI family TRAP transporter solute-binding subunit [Zetaproteobacteria bacterium]|nr:MAG: TAXI family TRAP transporter solute-binding subunit [Zetaproteobacteria bacterium]